MILLEKKWRLPDDMNIEAKEASDTASSLLSRLLSARGIDTPEQEALFLSKNPTEWHDPFLMNDMRVAVDRIKTAIDGQEKILVCGDYDADGITATAVLSSFLRKLGAQVDHVLPNRLTEGYGITDKLVERIEKKEPSLVVTVDCGVANEDSIRTLIEEGMDVIVTDHHEVKDSLPPALAVLDCKRPDNSYPFVHLCGAGVALKLIDAISSVYPGKVKKDEWRSYLDIVAIGTIADVVSLTGENRTIVMEGLRELPNSTHPGLKALLDLVRSKSNYMDNSISSTDVSFQIAPKLNATGRLGDAERSLELLLTDDPVRAEELAQELVSENTRRQEMEQALLDEVVSRIESDRQLISGMKNSSMPIVVAGENWHMGMLGIVANRIVQRYQRTAIVFTHDTSAPDVYKGSCRTAGDFPILDCFKFCGDTVQQYGGHKRAAGVAVEIGKYAQFLEKVREFASLRNTDDDLMSLPIDMQISPSDLTLDLAQEISEFEPFGEGNREPVFLLSSVRVTQPRGCGPMNRHLKMNLSYKDPKDQKEKAVDAIAFNAGEWADMFVEGSFVDVLVKLGINTWNGNSRLSLNILDIHFRKTGDPLWDTPQVLENLYRNRLPLRQVAMLGKCAPPELRPTGEEMTVLYRFLADNAKETTNLCDLSLLSRLIAGRCKKQIHPFKISRAMDIFQEAGLLDLIRINDERICFRLLSVQGKVKLQETKTFQVLFQGVEK